MATGRVPTTANSPLTAKGDLFGYSTTQARVAVGSDGETLVADSSATSGLRWQTPKSQNAVYNSAFDIWQRGTSIATGSGAAGSAYTADRWQSIMTSGAMTTSRQSVGDTTNLPNIRYCARVQRDSGSTNTNNVNLTQTLETADSIRFSGQAITFSFWARKGANYSSASDALSVQLYYGTGTDQNVIYTFTGSTAVINTTKTLTSTWQRFSITATVNAASTEIGYNFGYTPVGTAGAADYFEITGIQLETGSVATPYTRQSATLAGELAACQRYYWKTYLQGTAPATNTSTGIIQFSGFSDAGSSLISTVFFPVTMRAVPTITAYRIDGTSGSWGYERNGASGNGTVTADISGDRQTRIYTNIGAAWTGGNQFGHLIASAEL